MANAGLMVSTDVGLLLKQQQKQRRWHGAHGAHEKRSLVFWFPAPRMICPEPAPFQTAVPTEKPYSTSMLPITQCYLRRMLTLGKPSHFSLHSGHSVFFEDIHHKARQCRQKLWPQFKVVGLTRVS